MLVYNLRCGACGCDSGVLNDLGIATIFWTCPACGNESLTSLPTTDSTTLVTDPDVIPGMLSVTDNTDGVVIASATSQKQPIEDIE